MRWTWQREPALETRDSAYTDAWWRRAGRDPVTEALRLPACRWSAGDRGLSRRGEFVAYLNVVDGMLMVSPTADHDVTGTPIRRRGTTG